MSNKLDRFTQDARQVLTHAQEEAQRLNYNFIGTEHLLLGIIRQERALPAQLLAEVGVSLSQARAFIEEMIGLGKHIVFGRVNLTPRVMRVIEYGVEEAKQLQTRNVGVEHLMLGLLRENDGTAINVLRAMEVDLKALRAKLLEQMPRGEVPTPTDEFELLIADLKKLLSSSQDLDPDDSATASAALDFVAAQRKAERHSAFVARGTLLAVQSLLLSAHDIAPKALPLVGRLLAQSYG